MTRFNRKNYNKIMLIFLSDVLYWKKVNHPIIEKLYHNLNLFDDYPVENFHSLIRRNISSKVTAPETLRRYGINIDYEKHNNQFVGIFTPETIFFVGMNFSDRLLAKKTIFYIAKKNLRSYNKSIE